MENAVDINCANGRAALDAWKALAEQHDQVVLAMTRGLPLDPEVVMRKLSEIQRLQEGGLSCQATSSLLR